jgi:hypothetical protein
MRYRPIPGKIPLELTAYKVEGDFMSSRMNTVLSLIPLLFIAFATTAEAAVPKKLAAPVGRILHDEGVVTGGMAGAGYSLMDLRRTADQKKNFERIVIDIGDMQGQPYKGMPAYFHAELKKNPSRLVMDFDQTPVSRLDDARLSGRFKGSLFVKKTSMILDPEDKALNLTFDLKPGTTARIFQVRGQKSTSKVVVDLFTTSPNIRR